MAYDEALAERLREIVGDRDDVREKRMFGGLAFLVSGNMAVAASGQGGMLLRVAPEKTDELLERPAAEPFVMRGRPMDGWLRIDTSGLDAAALAEWAQIGLRYASSLPAKS